MHDDSGARVWSLELDVYGRPRHGDGDRAACPFRMPGQYEDEETGLYYNGFRYYDPDTGSYISADPMRLEGGERLYGYVDDPTKTSDPQGLHQIYAWLKTGGTPIVFPGNGTSYGQWWSTTTTTTGDAFGGMGHSERHLLQSIDGDPRLSGNKLVITSLGQIKHANQLSELPACSRCNDALDSFAKGNNVDIEYHWRDSKGRSRVTNYPCK